MRNKRPDFRKPTKPAHWAQSAVAVLIACALLLPAVQPAAAQEPAATQDAGQGALQVANGAGGVQIAWSGAPAAMAAAAATGESLLDALAVQMPFQRYQGYDLPFKVIPLRFSGPDAVTLPQITRLETMDLPAGLVVPGAPELPPVILEEGQEPPVSMETVALPEQPVFVLRQGIVKGEYLVMVAVSPIFVQNGVTKLATVLETNIPGANAILVAPWEYAEERATAIEAADAMQPVSEPAFEAAAVDAATATVTLVVANPGIQQLTRTALATANAAYTSGSLANVRLTSRGTVVPVQVVGDELRFYVESVGDRWNTSSFYQIALENDPARRSPAMGARTLAAPAAGAVSTVIDRGEWKDQYGFPSKYSSNYPGADGDHYFSAIFSTKAAGDAAPTLTANLRDPAKVTPPNTLPLVNDKATYTFAVTPGVGTDFDFTVNGAANQVHIDASYGPHTTTFTGVGNPETMNVTFVRKATPRTLYFESIGFARPVLLDMGGKGALFWGNPSDTVYRWNNDPQFGYAVWDVTDPANPVVLIGASAPGFKDSESGRRYLVAGEGFVHTPSVRAFRPVYARSLPAAHAVYVIPSEEYRAPLKPLTDLRIKQGYKVTVADVTRIYDAYSGGYVDARAIRRFLQDAYKWTNPRPISVVLVGDGTYDPKNYSMREKAPLLIPPYMMENIDAYIGEAACDNCFGQLTDNAQTGENPDLGDGPDGKVFDTELMVGRFPIKDVEELKTVVSKVVGYETTPDSHALWRSTALYLADNYLKATVEPTKITAQTILADGGGDFAGYSDKMRALNPNARNTSLTPRVYFDPVPQYQEPPATSDWWRYTSRAGVKSNVAARLLDGPALVVYNGHGQLFTLGELEEIGAPRDFLLVRGEPAALNNTRLWVQLSMTCLSASFGAPSDAGTTIDENFFLDPRGGAVAVWGSSGWSVATAHESLQKGFFGKLFAKPGVSVRLGDLLDAGYYNLMLSSTVREDVLRNFLLLGDPLTRFTIPAAKSMYLPIVDK